MKFFYGRISFIASYLVDYKFSYLVVKLLCYIGGKGIK